MGGAEHSEHTDVLVPMRSICLRHTHLGFPFGSGWLWRRSKVMTLPSEWQKRETCPVKFGKVVL